MMKVKKLFRLEVENNHTTSSLWVIVEDIGRNEEFNLIDEPVSFLPSGHHPAQSGLFLHPSHIPITNYSFCYDITSLWRVIQVREINAT
jgi:hypothetical protein